MTSNNNFESTLKKSQQKAKKAIQNQRFTEFFVMNEQRKVIEFLLTTKDNLLLEFYFLELLPEELRDFATLEIKNEAEENINHWYFNDELIVLLFRIDWGDSKQEISMEIDSEQFEVLITNMESIGIRYFDYKLCNEFLKNVVKSQADMISNSFNDLKIENIKHSSRNKDLKNYLE